jgi:beta-carotene ketolase (CrtW type)
MIGPASSRHHRGTVGVAVAVSILSAWAISLVVLLQVSLAGPWSMLWAPFAVAWMSWLFTGLFITGHDAMHGAIIRTRPQLNHALGAIAVGAYAMFDYRLLRQAHVRHHARPARRGDPDWHDGRRSAPVWWFLAFAARYLRPGQMLRLLVLFWFVQLFVDTPSFLLFWALPSLLSVFQLFYFGTYLPHREPEGGHTNRHHATSTSLGSVASLLTCFHFGGYHREHHEHPAEPWWRLPSLRSIPPETASTGAS